jgi:hypothetical protein
LLEVLTQKCETDLRTILAMKEGQNEVENSEMKKVLVDELIDNVKTAGNLIL